MAVGGAALPEGLNEDVASALVASVAANDAPLIGDRAATRGRGAIEDGDERGGAKGAVAPPPFETAANDATRDTQARQHTHPPSSRQRRAAHHERGASRGRSITEGGDEHAHG